MKNLSESELQVFFEENGFIVHLYENREEPNSAEIEVWTEGGVDMIIALNPFSPESFFEYVKDFDVDDEIRSYQNDKLYCNDFTLRQSLADFGKFKRFLKKAEFNLKKAIKPKVKSKYPNQYEAEATLMLSEAINSVYIRRKCKAKDLSVKIQALKEKLFIETFGEKSPWSFTRNSKGVAIPVWDTNKAKELGIES